MLLPFRVFFNILFKKKLAPLPSCVNRYVVIHIIKYCGNTKESSNISVIRMPKISKIIAVFLQQANTYKMHFIKQDISIMTGRLQAKGPTQYLPRPCEVTPLCWYAITTVWCYCSCTLHRIRFLLSIVSSIRNLMYHWTAINEIENRCIK